MGTGLNAEQRARVESLVGLLAGLTKAEQAEALADETDVRVRAEVEQRLGWTIEVSQAAFAATAAAVDSPWLAGDRVGDLELVRPIDRGGFGDVWIARNVVGGLCALKLVRTGASVEANGVRSVEEAVRQHPHLMPVNHVGSYRGWMYVVMPLADDVSHEAITNDTVDEYAPRTLKHELDMHRTGVDSRLAWEVGVALASALDHMHSSGRAHNDIKPGNVLAWNGAWRLADYGVSCRASQHPAGGTPRYGPTTSRGTFQNDLYAVGATLYEVLTGNDPSVLSRPGESRPSPRLDRRGRRLLRVSRSLCAEHAGIGSPRRMRKRLWWARWRDAVIGGAVAACLVAAVAVTLAWPRTPSLDRIEELLARLPIDDTRASGAIGWENGGLGPDTRASTTDPEVMEIVTECLDELGAAVPVEMQLEIARQFIDAGQFDGAEQVLERDEVVRARPHNGDVSAALGDLATARGAFETAHACYAEALEVGADPYEVALFAATAAWFNQDPHGARDYLRLWLEHAPEHTEGSDVEGTAQRLRARHNLASIEVGQRNLTDAIAMFDELIDDARNLYATHGAAPYALVAVDALINRGQARWYLGDKSGSRSDHDDACELARAFPPDDRGERWALSTAQALSSRGWIHMMDPNVLDAESALRDLGDGRRIMADAGLCGAVATGIALNLQGKEAVLLDRVDDPRAAEVYDGVLAAYGDLERRDDGVGRRASQFRLYYLECRARERKRDGEVLAFVEQLLVVARAGAWDRFAVDAQTQRARRYADAAKALLKSSSAAHRRMAVDVLREAMRRCPDDEPIGALFAHAMVFQGEPDREALLEVVDIVDDLSLGELDSEALAKALAGRAVAFARLGYFDDAIADVRDLAADHDIDVAMKACVAVGAEDDSRDVFDDLVEAFELLFGRATDDAGIRKAFAWLIVDPDSPHRLHAAVALPVARRAVELARVDPVPSQLASCLGTLAWSEWLAGDRDQAVDLMDEAIAAAPVGERPVYEESRARMLGG